MNSEIPSQPPRISVVIPTHNRPELLAKLIRSCMSQAQDVEILVMDDASSPPTEEMIRRDFPQVIYAREEVSRGPVFQRNKGAMLARGEFLFTLDDDVIPAAPGIFEQTLVDFDSPRVGAVAIPYCNVLQGPLIYHKSPQLIGTYITSNYYGGMIAFRRSAYLEAGGYQEFLFMHCEELELATRLYNLGYVIRIGRSAPLEHYESSVRNRVRLHTLGSRNYVLYCWYDIPSPYVWFRLPALIIQTQYKALRRGHWWPSFLGVLKGFKGLFHEFNKRRPISRQAYRIVRSLRNSTRLMEELEPQLPPLR